MTTTIEPHQIARASDPETSHQAAQLAVATIATVRGRVLAILQEHGPLTHDEIIERHRSNEFRKGWAYVPDSSIRTRVSELVRDGDVERVPGPAGKSSLGNAARRWRCAALRV